MRTNKVLVILSGIILTIIGLWIAVTRFFFGSSVSVGIIGGSDGPTAIFLSNSPASQLPVIALVAAVVFLLFLFVRKRKRKRNEE